MDQAALPTVTTQILSDDAMPRIGEIASPETKPAPASAVPSPSADDAPKLPTQAELEAAVLDLSRRNRKLDSREKELARREQENGRYAKFADLAKIAQSDPYAAGEQIAALVGLDVDALTEALVLKQSGGEGKKLSEAERLERLEKAHQQQREATENARLEAENKAKADREAAEADAKIAAHLTDLEGLVKKSDNFPLIADDLKAMTQEAFDLMAYTWAAARNGEVDANDRPYKPLTHFQALNLVEKALRDQTERRAPKLGYQKTAPAQQSIEPAASSTDSGLVRSVPQAPSRSDARQGIAPVERRNLIPTDEEIAADWARQFASR